MKVLLASSEAQPFFASGDLGEMAGALPAALRREDVDARVILPLCSRAGPELRKRLKYVANFTVPVSWRSQYCGLFEIDVGNVHFYFVDNEYYFNREELYGFYDDGERFAYFSRAVLETLSHVDFAPDVIHCNDWQTALVPVYLNLYYRHLEKHSRLKTIFTIHDLRYQGQFGPEMLEGTAGISRENYHIVEFDGIVNYTKGAIEMADLINAISPTYAREMLDPQYGCGLYDFLREKQHKLRGILNGVDVEKYDPAADVNIASRYDAANVVRGKAACKNNLRETLALAKSDAPLIGMVTPFEAQKGLDLLLYMAEEIIGGGIQLAIVGEGENHYSRSCEELSAKYARQFAVKVGMSPKLVRRVYAGSDMVLVPSRSEPCGLAPMLALRYGSIPIVRETGGLRDTVVDAGKAKENEKENKNEGNGFTFAAYSADAMRDACFRARDLYGGNRNEWNKLVRRAMKCDHSWTTGAKEYVTMYDEAIKLW